MSGGQGITGVGVSGGGHGGPSEGERSGRDGTCMRESDVDSTDTSNGATSSRDLTHTIMISNTSSASLQSRGSAQSSIAYTRYCYSPPLTQHPCHLGKDHSVKRNPQLLQRYRLEVIDVDRS